MRALFPLVLAVLPAVLLAQPDCPTLGFTDVVPASGETLSRCARSEDQCCTEGYITSVQARVVGALQMYLVEEFEDTVEQYQDDVENLLEFFGDEFLERLLRNLPGADYINATDPAFTDALQDLADNYNIPEDEDDDDEEEDGEEDQEGDDDKRKRQVAFNPSQFVDRLVASDIEAVAEALGGGDADTENCVRRVATSLVNRGTVSTVARQIQTIRQVITTLNRIGAFLKKQRAALSESTFIEECVSRFIDIAFCSRCTENTPPMCFNTCNALLRACYSPYYTVFNEQYARLWQTAQRALRIGSSAVESLFDNEATLLDSEAFVERVTRVCNVEIPDNSEDDGGVDQARRKRQGEEPTPTTPTTPSEESPTTPDTDATTPTGGEDTDATPTDEEDTDGTPTDEEETPSDEGDDEDTTGDSDSSEEALNDDSTGIAEGLVEDIFELRGAFNYRMEGLQLCFSALNSMEDCSAETPTRQSCNGTNICTARCHCTAGEGPRETDTEEFLLNDIEDQVNNPVLPLEVGVLNAQAAALAADNPVDAFLTSSAITSVNPEPEEENQESSATGCAVTSLTIFLLALLLIVFV